MYDPALTAFADKVNAIAVAEADLSQMRSERDGLRTAFEILLTQRGLSCELAAAGDAAKIQSAGFDIQATGTPTTSLSQPQNFVATMGDNEGEIDVSCNAVKRARSYIIECREHIDGQPPGAWAQVKISSRSSAVLTGLVSGRKYAFRIRALGPNDTESPWSDEAVCMAP